MDTIYLIDNSNFCYKFKAVHSYSKIAVNGVITDTSVLTGYIKALKQNIFNNIVIVLDGIPATSLSILPGYKGQRNHEKNQSTLEVPHLEVVKFLTKIGERIGKNIKVVCSPLQEADQVISSISHMVSDSLPPRWKFTSALNEKPIEEDRMLRYLLTKDLLTHKLDVTGYKNVIIASTDADMAQLQRLPNVMMDTSTSGKAVVSQRTADSVGQLPPEKIPFYKSILGDSSDNIPQLTLPWSRDKIVKLLQNANCTPEQFYDRVVLGKSLDSNLEVIARHIISTEQVSDFKRNWDVAVLKFYSVPFVVEYTDYDIDKTIQKYKLKL